MNMNTTIEQIANDDIAGLKKAQEEYGNSWLRRGGVGAFMMMARKFDRLERAIVQKHSGNILEGIQNDQRVEGIIDDVRDLRRYLVLVASQAVVEMDNEANSTYMDALSFVLLNRIAPIATREAAMFMQHSSKLHSITMEAGVDTWGNIANFWNEIETVAANRGFDILEALKEQVDITDDLDIHGIKPTYKSIEDLISVLLQIECYMANHGSVSATTVHRDNNMDREVGPYYFSFDTKSHPNHIEAFSFKIDAELIPKEKFDMQTFSFPPDDCKEMMELAAFFEANRSQS